MFNYTLNEEESKSFVRYYKEDGDRINIYYHDKTSILSVENNDDAKTRLNNIQEQQVKNHYKTDKTLGKAMADSILATCGLFITQLLAVIIFGTIGSLLAGPKAYLFVAKLTSLIYSIPALYLLIVVPTSINMTKFNLFLKYKDRLNKKIDELNDETDKKNENSLNKVETKKIKNLCINDINFMSYFKLKKMTNQIDKEERKARKIAEKMSIQMEKEERKARKIAELESTTCKRASDLGIDRAKVLVITKNSTK